MQFSSLTANLGGKASQVARNIKWFDSLPDGRIFETREVDTGKVVARYQKRNRASVYDLRNGDCVHLCGTDLNPFKHRMDKTEIISPFHYLTLDSNIPQRGLISNG